MEPNATYCCPTISQKPKLNKIIITWFIKSNWHIFTCSLVLINLKHLFWGTNLGQFPNLKYSHLRLLSNHNPTRTQQHNSLQFHSINQNFYTTIETNSLAYHDTKPSYIFNSSFSHKSPFLTNFQAIQFHTHNKRKKVINKWSKIKT